MKKDTSLLEILACGITLRKHTKSVWTLILFNIFLLYFTFFLKSHCKFNKEECKLNILHTIMKLFMFLYLFKLGLSKKKTLANFNISKYDFQFGVTTVL